MIGNVDKSLRSMGHPPRKFRFIVNNFSSYPDLVLGTDLLVTASLAMRHSVFSSFAVAPLPAGLEVEPITYSLGWSKRKANMPCLRWLIDLFLECNEANVNHATPPFPGGNTLHKK